MIRSRLLAVLVTASLVTTGLTVAPARALTVAGPEVTVDLSAGNEIATGAVLDPDPANARVTVSNRYHFWAGLDLLPPVGGARLAPTPIGEDARGLYGLLGLIGPEATSAWAGTFDPAGASQAVWLHYDLATGRGAQALALTSLTLVADTFGAPLLARSPATVIRAITLLTDLAEFTNLLGAVQRNDPWGIVKAWSLLLQSPVGRDAIRLALSELGVIVSDGFLKSLGSVAGAWDFIQTLRDLLRAGLGGHMSGLVTFSVARGAGATATASLTPSLAPVACNVAYATGWQDEGVYQLDMTRGLITAQTKTSLYNNRYLAWNDVRRELYVLADNGGVIVVVDTAPLREVATISTDVGWNGYSIVVSSDGSTIVATFSSGDTGNQFRRVVEFDTGARTAKRAVILDQTLGESYAAISPDGTQVYVSWDNKLDIYDAESMSLLKRVTDVTTESGRLVVSSDGRYLFIVQPGGLLKYDLGDGHVVATAQIDGGSFSWTEMTRDGTAVWVAGNDKVSRVPLSLDGITSFQASAPIGFDESSDGRRLFVANGNLTTVSTIDLATGRTTGSIPVSNVTALAAVPCR